MSTGAGEVAVSPPRDRAVLAVLLLHANHVVSVDRLIEAVWADRMPRGARAQVQGCVSRLRRQLADAGAGDQAILTDRAGYRISVDPRSVDLLEFRRLRDEARTAAGQGRDSDACHCYREALALWRGSALTGVDSDLVRRAAATIDEERMQALEESVPVALAQGKAGELVSELTEMVDHHPYRETLHAALMRALHRAGRRADALAAYQRVRQLLQDDLGTEPGAELQELHQAILSRAVDLRPPPGATPPQDRSSSPPPRELPADVAGFTGRAEALKDLDAMLADRSAGMPAPVVISAITGTAGIGKTALAVHWAHRIADQFPDGQLHLNLRGYATKAPLRPIEALAALLRSLGTPPDQIPTEEAQAAGLYRTRVAERRMLVLLDNAGSVAQVRPLLPGSPGSLVVVTSRSRLTGLVARDGARRLTLDVLTADEAYALLAALLGPERVGVEPEATAELAWACGYLPLALRIAAAHLADNPTTIADYLARLSDGDRIAALQVDDDEESSVPAAFDISYRALPAAAARLFRLLGLVPGPDFTPEASAALAGATVAEAAGLLRQLAGAHLIDDRAQDRFSLHDLLRHYARRLAETEDPVRDPLERLFSYYLQATDAAARCLSRDMVRLPVPPPEPGSLSTRFEGGTDALGWLDAELPNLLAAVTHAAHRGSHRTAWLLADCLRVYLMRRHRTVDWLSVATASLAAAQQAGDLQAQSAAWLSLSKVRGRMGSYGEALEGLGRAVDLARRANWLAGQSVALRSRFMALDGLGRLDEAADDLAEALRLDRLIGNVDGEASTLTGLGIVNQQRGRLQEAADKFHETLAIDRQLGSATGEAASLTNLGTVHHDLGQLDRGIDELGRALVLHREDGSLIGEILALNALAVACRDAGRLADALDHATISMRLARDQGSPRLQVEVLNAYGRVLLRLGRVGEALDELGQALDLVTPLGTPNAEIVARLGLAEAHHRLGNHDTAAGHGRRALELADTAGYRVLQGQALTILAQVTLGQGLVQEASDNARQALDCHRETGHRLGEAHTLAVLGHINQATGDGVTAREHWRAAVDLFTAIGAAVPEDIPAQEH